jgi:signal transduction histidine kinase
MVRMSDFDLEIVLENLVDNAVKYTPDGGHVSVSAAIEGSQRRYVKISVHDDGPGIPEHQRMSVFERFYRVGHKPGIGLGLHICSTRVTACGGKIWVAVGPSGKGTSVCMLVPEGGES